MTAPSDRRATRTLSNAQAKRIALAAQGFADPRPTGRVDRRHLRRVLDRIGLLQIDSVNVLVRSQELPLFARLGPHPRTLIDDATRDGELFEYWVHEASLVPTDQYHLYRWRMRGPHPWPGFRRRVEKQGDYIEEVYRRVVEEGPLVAGDLKARVGKKGTWWDHDDGKTALEALFFEGRVAARRRPRDFARVYDLPERIIPAEALARPGAVRARRPQGAAGAGGEVSRDRHAAGPRRLPPPRADPVQARVGRARRRRPLAPRHRARVGPPRVPPSRRRASRGPVRARALLSPFDPVVWNRERALRMFGFHYRIEIYTPTPKRQYGYYVLPFLLDDELVGRVDLKADRAKRARCSCRARGRSRERTNGKWRRPCWRSCG